MAKPKSNISKPTDEQVFAATKGQPFKKCPSCGNSIGPSQPYCWECKRLVELGMKTAMKQFQPDQDTQEKQSYASNRHDGYSDSIKTKKKDTP